MKISTIDCHNYYKTVTHPTKLVEAMGKDKIHNKADFMEQMVKWADNEIPPFYHTITDSEKKMMNKHIKRKVRIKTYIPTKILSLI